MQYSVPQFVDVEDTIIGPFTLKQFLIFLFGGLIIFFYYSIFKLGWIFFTLTIPTAVVFGVIAKGRFNGRPTLYYLTSFIRFYFSPRLRVFKRGADSSPVIKKENIGAGAELAKPQGEVTGRLKKLAYLLDQKTAEEQRLIQSGKTGERWLNQI